MKTCTVRLKDKGKYPNCMNCAGKQGYLGFSRSDSDRVRGTYLKEINL
jgi:hypothetical protein